MKASKKTTKKEAPHKALSDKDIEALILNQNSKISGGFKDKLTSHSTIKPNKRNKPNSSKLNPPNNNNKSKPETSDKTIRDKKETSTQNNKSKNQKLSRSKSRKKNEDTSKKPSSQQPSAHPRRQSQIHISAPGGVPECSGGNSDDISEETLSSDDNNSKKKISDEELMKLLGEGLSQNQIAKRKGMNRITINKRVKRLGKKAIPFMFQKHSDILGPQLKTMDQLAMINEEALSYIQDKNMPKILKMQAMKRVEAQNEMQIRLLQLLHSINEVKEFQKAVLEVISSVDPKLKNEVLMKLRSKKSTTALLVQ